MNGNRSKLLFALMAAGGLSACAHNPPVTQGRAAIPVECKEAVPERPAMPTENLPADSKVDPYVQAAASEIKLREGYEGKLRTALEACTNPIIQAPK